MGLKPFIFLKAFKKKILPPGTHISPAERSILFQRERPGLMCIEVAAEFLGFAWSKQNICGPCGNELVVASCLQHFGISKATVRLKTGISQFQPEQNKLS